MFALVLCGVEPNSLDQVGRVSNPLGTVLSSIIVFGSQLLALTEDGGRLLIWDTAGGGKNENFSIFVHQFTPSHAFVIQMYNLQFSLISALQLH